MYVYPALQLQTPSTLFGVVSWGLRGNLRSTPGFLDHFGMENPWVFPIFPPRFFEKKPPGNPSVSVSTQVRAPVHLGAVFKNVGECPSRSMGR